MEKFNGSDVPFDVLLMSKDGSKQKGEFVPFPTEPDTLLHVLERLGLGPNDWQIATIDCHVSGIEDAVMSCENLDELNYLAKKLAELSSDDLSRFSAVLEIGEHDTNIAEMINLCDNLECYDFYAEINSYDSLGRYWLFHESALDYSTLETLEDYIDFDSYGHDVVHDEGGDLADDCYVVPSGRGFTDYYSGDPEDIPAEYRVTTLLQVPELTEDERLEKAIELATGLDRFFRDFYPDYEQVYPNVGDRQADICDCLFAGRIADYDRMLDDLGQTSEDVLPSELAAYKAGIRYDPTQDVEPAMIRVLVVEPRKTPYLKDIKTGISPEHEIGGSYRLLYPSGDPVVIISGTDGPEAGKELNRTLYGADGKPTEVLSGKFLVAGLREGGYFASLTDAMAEKYTQRFQTIEVYIQDGSRTFMFQVEPETLARMSSAELDSIIHSSPERKPSIRDRLTEARQAADLQRGRTSPPDHSEPTR